MKAERGVLIDIGSSTNLVRFGGGRVQYQGYIDGERLRSEEFIYSADDFGGTMAKIVAVHGVGHQFEGEETLRIRWLPALKDGLTRAGRKLESDADLTCAFYGDLFRSAGKKAFADPELDVNDVTEPWEEDMLMMWWERIARTDAGVSAPTAQTKVWAPHMLQRALNSLSQSKFFTGLAEKALIADLKQVYRYLHEPAIRMAARDRVLNVIAFDSSVLIAHSLGSVVAYESLCAHPNLPIKTFVTMGSPLGIANLIFHKLDPPPSDGRGRWPGHVQHWFNITDESDIVALEQKLNGHFSGQIQDRLIDNGASAHDTSRYLTAKETGDAIATGL